MIEPAEGQALRFERQAGQWQMTEPYRMPANTSRLDALARVVEAPILSQFPLPAERLTEFGLDRPLRLRLDDLVFEFGGNDPLNHHRYLRTGDQVALTLDRFYHHLSASAEQLVSPALLPPSAQLASIQTPSYRLELKHDGWQLEPPQAQLSGDDLADRVGQWASAQGLWVQRFEQPAAEQTVELRLTSGALFRFLVIEQDGATWLVRPDNGLGYQLPSDSDLLQPPQPAAESAPTATAAPGDA